MLLHEGEQGGEEITADGSDFRKVIWCDTARQYKSLIKTLYCRGYSYVTPIIPYTRRTGSQSMRSQESYHIIPWKMSVGGCEEVLVISTV